MTLSLLRNPKTRLFYLFIFFLVFCVTANISAQTSTITFEGLSGGSTSFANNGYTFNIVSQAGIFRIQSNYPGTGWNGTANDNVYIDNTGTTNINSPSFSVKSSSGFTVSTFWVFLSNTALNQSTSSGTLIITGKLGGVTKFTTTKTSGFNTTFNATTGTTGVSNGYTLIDLGSLNGQNNSNTIIDEIQLQSTGDYVYMCLDALTWRKNTLPVSPDANGIVYVKKGAAGNGPSWNYAVPELADALKAAKTNTDIKQIWVAGGTYKPMYSPADNNFGNADGRNNAFLLVKDVKVYGGFAGTETTLVQRDLSIVTNKSTLSGDIDANDVITNDLSTTINGNNSYHVLIAAGAMGIATLDGFTITGGNASVNSTITINNEIVGANSGGGLVNINATLGLSNLNIAYNSASFSGAGIFNYKSATININNTAIANNKATGNGGGIFSDAFASSLRFTNVQVVGNMATANGGGICDYSISGNSSFTNVLITGNTSGTLGGGMYLSSATSSILNTTISGNTAVTAGGGLHNEFQAPLIYNSIILGNNTGVNNNNSTPTIKNSLIQGLSGTADGNINATGVLPVNVFVSPLAAGLNSEGNYRLKSGSPAINSGNNTLFIGLDVNTKDLDNNLRLVGSNIDLGPYESALQSQTITAANVSKTYGDVDFEPGATASSGLTVSYASADNSIAEAYQDAADNNKWKLKIKKVGTVNITASQVGGNGYNAASDQVFVLTIQPKALTVSATASNKVYDATNAATVNLSSNAISGDNIALSYTSATFSDENVANGKPVSVSGISLSGTDAGNYTFNTTASTTADITPFALTVSATGSNKVYDATSNATVTLSSNALSGDNITLAYTSATFNSKTV
ncbi:YDG domain-containing protein, partial [Pedobacter sp. ASV28]|uniref:YDG domain-containing protein n=1 Tax=Pedobacter sp. ASV28 TaxID=2795123 RepID=UPI0018EDAF87